MPRTILQFHQVPFPDREVIAIAVHQGRVRGFAVGRQDGGDPVDFDQGLEPGPVPVEHTDLRPVGDRSGLCRDLALRAPALVAPG